MAEPKFSDAACFGKEFDTTSKICKVCLANKSCRKIVAKLAGTKLWPVALAERMGLSTIPSDAEVPSVLSQSVLAGRSPRWLRPWER